MFALPSVVMPKTKTLTFFRLTLLNPQLHSILTMSYTSIAPFLQDFSSEQIPECVRHWIIS